jgi:hypothetical protein
VQDVTEYEVNPEGGYRVTKLEQVQLTCEPFASKTEIPTRAAMQQPYRAAPVDPRPRMMQRRR